ncbi:ArsR/SmtB family transcription factor [Agromyces salentinus]|uniref:HTH arsR-type domain-containing protein n=1 Tax=Agromyces salentinus TaxID=269421 RepID=A0ABP4Z8M7_9MICO|nr:metalloregulator ArsR/SmtB family transcription factor [Agromyces salentinus]
MMHPFEIAAEPIRRRVIEVLATGRHPASLLADVVTSEFLVSRSAVSHHLRILRDAGVVSVIPDAAERLYGLEEEYLLRLDQAVGELFTLWDHRYGFDVERTPFPLVAPSRTPQSHRAGRKGLRGTTRRGLEPDGWGGPRT